LAFLRRVFELSGIIKRAMSSAVAIILKPIAYGWAVCLTNGRELARFRGPGAHYRALRYLRTQFASAVPALPSGA
jgi:hypothetical protein